MSKYNHHKYEWSKPFSSVRHQWSLIGPRGGLHFHVTISANPEWPDSAGLEIHYTRGNAPDYLESKAPSQVPCWLLKEPCWHDGTSLYASETLWPMIEAMLRSGDHEAIFCTLEREADSRFGTEASHD